MPLEPRRIPREDHPVSRKQFSNAALKVLYGLRDAGYEAYMVGGAVRDVYAGILPKDFDVATNATPEQTKRVFRNARLIGRRFVIVHVRFGDEIIEVTTFRGAINDTHARDETGRILSDNQYGSLESDALRRDFTANALYYDIADYTVVDFTGGLEDVAARRLRLIGEPELRYREDPVRMLRAIRIANKLDFNLEAGTADPIPHLASLLREIPPARLFDEVIKMLLSKEAVANFRGLRDFGLLQELFPVMEATLKRHPGMVHFVEVALGNSAARIVAEQSVTPAFLYASMLWPSVAERFVELMHREGHHPNAALAQAANEVVAQASLRVMIPKRFSMPMSEIWELQPRFEQRSGSRPKRLLTHPRFRAAYDFLLLRAQVGDASPEVAQWWAEAQAAAGPQVVGQGGEEGDAATTGDDEGDAGTGGGFGEGGEGGDAAGAARRPRRRGGRNRRR